MLHEIQKALWPNALDAKDISRPLPLDCLTNASLASAQNSSASPHKGWLR